MRVLFDTNVIIDVIVQREPFYNDSRAVFHMAAQKDITGIVSAGSVTDVYYLTRKAFHNSESAQKAISKLSDVIYIADTKGADIQSALKFGFPDFEDAVVSAVANRERVDFIVTRNVKDFVSSSVEAITPSDFLQRYAG